MQTPLSACLLASVLLIASVQVEPANVLLSGVFGDGSHFLSMVPIGKSLLERGHSVTFLVSDAYLERAVKYADSLLFNFEVFRMPGLKNRMDDIYSRLGEIAFKEDSSLSQAQGLQKLFGITNGDACKTVFEDQELLHRLSEYDAFVLDVVWICGVHVKSYLERHKYTKDIRIAFVAPMTPIPFVFEEAGSPFIPSYQPMSTTAFSSSMSFTERCRNLFSYIFFTFMLNNKIFLESFSDLVPNYDLDRSLTYTVRQHVDLYLINVDFSVEYPFSLTPNIIPVGGLTSRPANPLDQKLEDFMQSSGDNGVVVFSLGSYFAEVTNTNPEIVKMFIDAFSRFPQKFILHLKRLPSDSLPDNMMALPWLPLNDLLGHPKTRVVVYHGGNNAFYEALYHGVPLVIMPLAGDQVDVARRVVSNGIGTRIDKSMLSPDYIYEQLNEVLSNPNYQATASRLSGAFRDRPMTPADTAAFWIEHVVKHGGDHLRPATLDMSFFQIYLLDVVFVGLVCVFVVCYVLLRLITFCCCPRKVLKSKHE